MRRRTASPGRRTAMISSAESSMTRIAVTNETPSRRSKARIRQRHAMSAPGAKVATPVSLGERDLGAALELRRPLRVRVVKGDERAGEHDDADELPAADRLRRRDEVQVHEDAGDRERELGERRER